MCLWVKNVKYVFESVYKAVKALNTGYAADSDSVLNSKVKLSTVSAQFGRTVGEMWPTVWVYDVDSGKLFLCSWAQELFSKIHKTGLPTPFELLFFSHMHDVHIFFSFTSFPFQMVVRNGWSLGPSTEWTYSAPRPNRITMISKQTKTHAHMSYPWWSR